MRFSKFVHFDDGFSMVVAFIVAATVIYLLQLFPYTGVILMILAGPIWIGLLLHLLMAALTVQALRRVISRAWLIAPALYYGGGYALHLASLQRAREEKIAIERANAAQSAKVDLPFRYLATGVSKLEVFRRFRAESATFIKQYVHKKDYTGFLHTVYIYNNGSSCDVYVPASADEPEPAGFAWDLDLFPAYKGSDKTIQCLIPFEVPDGNRSIKAPDYEIMDYLDRTRPPTLLFGRYLIHWIAKDLRSGKTLAQVDEGNLWPLPSVQTVIAGCALNSGGPSWDCSWGLMTGSESITVGYKDRTDNGNPLIPVDDPETSPTYALGRALGLTPRTPTDH